MEPAAGPIHSRLADDPEHAEAVDAFVVALAERVDDLQDSESCGDFKVLGDRARALGADADRAGYPILKRSAEEVGAAAEQNDGELARKALVQLTGLAQRVRQGHRGALG